MSEDKYTITVAGIGPGAGSGMTREVADALGDCDVIVGYPVYLDLLRKDFPGKEYLSTPMREEEERCRLAFDEAEKGRKVVLVCGGDPGIYGLASLMLELSDDYPDCEVEILPGVTAATGGAALLGAPLSHDLAIISLSDAMTGRERIENRLRLAAEADLVICLYNPASKSRPDSLKRACGILMEVLGSDRICGVARQIGRAGEQCEILTLSELADYPADMFTTVFIGNSETKLIAGKMVTPRGYHISPSDEPDPGKDS